MDNFKEIPMTNRIALLMSLFLALTARTVIGAVVFRGIVPAVFFAVLYICIVISLINSFDYGNGHLYAPKHFFLIFLLFLVVLVSMSKVGQYRNLLYYGIAFTMPFVLKVQLKSERFVSRIFVGFGFFLLVGSILNYFFPAIYTFGILPLFTDATQKDLLWQASYGTAYPGFTSQVGYTAFFLSIGIGSLFAFRKHLYKKTFAPIFIALLFGMFLTGKRGPFIFLFTTIAWIYYLESENRQKITRILKIIGVFIISYLLLYILATYTENPGINRIFNAIQTIVISRDIEDVGREQLRDQAWIYFLNNPVTGIGWGNFKNLFAARGTHVHNIYLQLLCESGIVGFLCFAFFFGKCLINTLKKMNSSPKDSFEYCWLSFSLFIQVYFLLYGISGNPLYDTEETIIYFFAVGISFLPMIEASEESNQIV